MEGFLPGDNCRIIAVTNTWSTITERCWLGDLGPSPFKKLQTKGMYFHNLQKGFGLRKTCAILRKKTIGAQKEELLRDILSGGGSKTNFQSQRIAWGIIPIELRYKLRLKSEATLPRTHPLKINVESRGRA